MCRHSDSDKCESLQSVVTCFTFNVTDRDLYNYMFSIYVEHCKISELSFGVIFGKSNGSLSLRLEC